MRHNFLETITGAAVLVVAGIFFIFGYQFSGPNTENFTHVAALFDDVSGISVGNDIKIAGVKVGHVSSITIDKETFQAKVGLEIDAKLAIPSDSSAEILSESLLGGKFVGISPGGEETMLKNGDVITFTQSSISFESLVSKYLFSSTSKD